MYVSLMFECGVLSVCLDSLVSIIGLVEFYVLRDIGTIMVC